MGNTDNSDSISQYCDYFRGLTTEISSLEKDLFKRILLLAEIESLAKSRYAPQLTGESELRNGDRFKRLIREHGDWPNVGRYSVPQIVYGLRERELTSSRLYLAASESLDAWRTGGPVPLDDDFEETEVEDCDPTPEERALAERKRHDALLWTYRNNLVHEFREPGYPWPFPRQEVPHYISMSAAGDDAPGKSRESWELSYPILWLQGLALTIVDNLAAHWSAANLDPYEAYDFGSLWVT